MAPMIEPLIYDVSHRLRVMRSTMSAPNVLKDSLEGVMGSDQKSQMLKIDTNQLNVMKIKDNSWV